MEPKCESETAAYISNQTISVIRKVGPHKVYVVVSDNAPNMQAAWELITLEFPHISCVGCGAHCVDLLIEDIMKLKSLFKIFKMGKIIVKTLKKVIPKAHFKKWQEEQQKRTGKNCITLKIPSETRFAGVVIFLNALILNKDPIQQTVVMTEVSNYVSRGMRSIALDDVNFWRKAEAWLLVLKPLARAIALIESDSSKLSDVPELFHFVLVDIRAALLSSPLQKHQRRIEKFIAERKDFTLKPIHFAANILDPRYKGKHLSRDEKSLGLDVIEQFCDHLNLDRAEVMANLAQFRMGTGLWARQSVIDSSKSLDPAVWWQGHCADEALTPIASRLLLMPASSASNERVWSNFGWTHSDKRNRLKNDKVAKEVSVRMNTHLIDTEALEFKNKMKKKLKLLRPVLPIAEDTDENVEREDTGNDSGSENESDFDYDSSEGEDFDDEDWEMMSSDEELFVPDPEMPAEQSANISRPLTRRQNTSEGDSVPRPADNDVPNRSSRVLRNQDVQQNVDEQPSTSTSASGVDTRRPKRRSNEDSDSSITRGLRSKRLSGPSHQR